MLELKKKILKIQKTQIKIIRKKLMKLKMIEKRLMVISEKKWRATEFLNGMSARADCELSEGGRGEPRNYGAGTTYTA